MASNGAKPLGVTAPLSTALPTESENQASNSLIEELKRQNNYESTADTNKRQAVLLSLQAITEEFVRVVCRAQGASDTVVNSAGGRIFTYGSFRLGVFGPGSDIDTLVVAPNNVIHNDFFTYFPDLLLKMAPEGSITSLSAVQDAFVPIIKFDYSGISIDLIFSRIAVLTQIPRDLSLLNNELLKGLDQSELRSLNGTRVTDEILELVPQKSTFRTALRGIKLWAQRRAVYANIMGFPGGVAWAMLVARVCQLYPQATSSTIVLKFFKIMEKWPWPTPVLLKPIEQHGPINARVWNPKLYHGDKYHLMPIITPAYPSMCATHNICNSTMEVINRELRRGGEISDRVMMGKAKWKDLFAKHTFFTEGYKYYLSVISASTTKEAQLIWSGLVESKVRHLVVLLEGHGSIALAHPFNKGFERVHRCRSEDEIDRSKSGSLEYQAKDIPTGTTGHGPITEGTIKDEAANEKERTGGDDSITMVYTTTHYIGLELNEGSKSLDLSWEVDEFKRLCMGWDKHNSELNAINVVHTRNCDLPDDVFTEGEVKPTRSQKKKTANGTSKKRRTTDESGSAPVKRQQTSVAAAG